MRIIQALLIAALLLAFAMRVVYLTRFDFHEDEFYSMLAISRTMEQGAPVLPSGLFYDKGLAYTYLTAVLAKLAGFSETLARWPALLAGLLGIAAMFAAGRGLFGASLAGLLAALALAFDRDAIAWSTRARMYTLAQAALPLLFLATWRLVHRPDQRKMLIVLGLIALTLLAHSGIVVLIPAMAVVALLYISWQHRFSALGSLTTWPVILAGGLVVALAVGLVLGGSATELPARVVPDDPNLPLEYDSTAEPLAETVVEFLGYLTEGERLIWLVLALGIGVWALCRVGLRRSGRDEERAVAFLFIIMMLTFITMLFLPSKEFKRDRYLFLLLLPQVYLLGGATLDILARGAGRFVRYRWAAGGVAILALAGLAYSASPVLQPAEGEARYDHAYALVRAHWQPGDVVMASRMASCYLYLDDGCEYYLREFGVRATDKFAGYYTDWYVGAPWIGNQGDFNRVLASGKIVWFVVRESQLTGNFTADFIQQILAQMQLVHQAGDVLVFRSLPTQLPLPQTPDYLTVRQWEGNVRLAGYSVTWLQDDVLAITLFWENIPLSDDFKVFIHLRSPDGPNLLQADHVPLEDLPYDLRRAAWGTGDLVRDRVIVSLPSEADVARDRFIVGIYHATSGERLPLLNDQSGENGVWIDDIR